MTAFSDFPTPWRERLDVVAALSHQAHRPAAIVGGCVRDIFLGRMPKDWDVVIEGAAKLIVEQAADRLKATVVDHPKFLTFTLHFSDGTHLDVATARAESYPRPGQLPTVRPATLIDDARRRDFTANALYWLLNEKKVLDPTGGKQDMNDRCLRVLHDGSFHDDPTRLYRAVRYAARYGWRVDEKTRALARRSIQGDEPLSVSVVRRRHELFRALEEDDPAPGLRLAWEWGLWKFWNPHWTYSDDLAQRVGDVERESPPVRRLAVLLGEDREAAETALTYFSVPRDLKRAVLNHLREKLK